MEKKLVLGPPGTGKTTFLVNTFRKLLERGVDPERIAYVSFTRKAAQEARDRCVQSLSLPASRFPHVKTLHSIAFRENGLATSDVMNNENYREVSDYLGINIMPVNESRGLGEDTMIGFHLALARNLRRDYEQHFRSVAGSTTLKRFNFGSLDRGGSLAEFLRAARVLEQYKRKNNLWDFHDMLEAGTHCDPLPVDYAIIDEAQDLSPLQWQFAAQMFKNVKTCWIAGDDDQAVYSWSGADLHTFRNMQAERTVLDQSYRLPESIWKFAIKIAEMIDDRYEKEWKPRSDSGELHFVTGLEECPLNNSESWYLLTRTRSQQYELTRWLRFHGFPYTQNGKDSIKKEHIRLANTWTKLQRGEYVPVSSALAVYDFMRDEQLQPDARKKLSMLPLDDRIKLPELVSSCGLINADGIWHDVLLIDKTDSNYYRAVKDNLGMDALISEPRIAVHTMHGVKGGEADNVYFSNSMGQKPYSYYKTGHTRDDEARIFYVAATRARKRLFVKMSPRCPFPVPKN